MPDLDLQEARSEPLAAMAATSPRARGVTLAEVAPRWRALLRLRAAETEPAGQAVGLALPTTACRAIARGEIAALWLGPDEWLLIAPEAQGPKIGESLAAALAGKPASVVDISHRQIALTITGARATDVLSAFVALDLDTSAFPVGMCTRTILGKAEIVLWRTATDTFHIETARSLGAYVWASLEEARREHLDPDQGASA